MARLWILFHAGTVVLGLSACSGNTTASTTESSDAAGESPDAAGGDCNSLVNDGPVVTPEAVALAAPAALGGTISDGKWVLTAVQEYTGPGGETGPLPTTFSGVLVISGVTMQQVGMVKGQLKHYTSTIAVSGTTLTTTDTCPVAKASTQQFTATAAELRVYDTAPGITLEQTFTKY